MLAKPLSLNAKLVAGCLVMFSISLILSTSLILIFGEYHLRTERDFALLATFKRTLIAISTMTLERGPIASLFDAEPNANPKATETLASYRAAGDAAIATILHTGAEGLDLSADEDLVAAVDRAKMALDAARKSIDAIIALPRSERTAERMHQGLENMFAAGDLLRPIAVATIVRITAEDPALAGPSLIAMMLGDLRDYCGRFGAQLVPYVTMGEPLPDSVVIDIARLRERILTIWQLSNRQGGLYPGNRELNSYREQINAQFFGTGLQTIDRAVAAGRATGQFGITTQEMSARFIPTLQPIEQMRIGFLQAAIDRLADERSFAFILLCIMSVVAALIVAATVGLIFAARHYVLRPLLLASNHVVALSSGASSAELKSPTNSHEMLQLFDALEGLRVMMGERHVYTEKLKILSETDGLTGLVNRRMFDRVGQGWTEFEGLARDVTVIMMDLDQFKTINDRYGHIAGDQVLKHAAQIVQRVCRKSDLAARYGGEEIAIILFQHDIEVAVHVANRIRTELAAAPVVISDGREIPVTASFGVSGGRRGSSDWLDVIQAADGALYAAKAAGRNRVCRAGGSNPGPQRVVA